MDVQIADLNTPYLTTNCFTVSNINRKAIRFIKALNKFDIVIIMAYIKSIKWKHVDNLIANDPDGYGEDVNEDHN